MVIETGHRRATWDTPYHRLAHWARGQELSIHLIRGEYSVWYGSRGSERAVGKCGDRCVVGVSAAGWNRDLSKGVFNYLHG